MNLEPVIGLEIHIQLKTKSKMFCSCDNSGEQKAINSCVCPVCMGHPGTLPVANKKAIEWSVKSAIALNCEIPKESKFDRKHYFYPDLPKGYQISQYDMPFGKNGFLEIDGQKIRINRLHLEEDAAKLLHPTDKNYSLVDYNRSSTPLMEVVTEPDVKNPRTAGIFLRELRAIIRSLKVSDADMEKGHLRCDANISLRAAGSTDLNPKTEIKNLNSFKAVEQALAYEIKRQTLLWEQKNSPKVESTRGWDDNKGVTVEHRSKEAAYDYRYFPEPDIPPINFTASDIEKTKKELPELPQQKRKRFINQYGFSIADASILVRNQKQAEYTEQVMSELFAWIETLDQTNEKLSTRLSKLAANWLINDFAPLIENKWASTLVTPENFAELIAILAENKINSKTAQNILKLMIKTGKDPSDIMQEGNLEQVGESDELVNIVKKVIADNKKVSDDYKSGKQNAIKFLLGAVMRETQGRANPQIVEKLLKKNLK